MIKILFLSTNTTKELVIGPNHLSKMPTHLLNPTNPSPLNPFHTHCLSSQDFHAPFDLHSSDQRNALNVVHHDEYHDLQSSFLLDYPYLNVTYRDPPRMKVSFALSVILSTHTHCSQLKDHTNHLQSVGFLH